MEDLRWAWPTKLRPPENGRGLICRHLEWQKAMCTMCCAVLWSVLDAQEEVSCRFTEFQTILSQKVINKSRKNNPAVVLGRAIKF